MLAIKNKVSQQAQADSNETGPDAVLTLSTFSGRMCGGGGILKAVYEEPWVGRDDQMNDPSRLCDSLS